jgi:hypothetical protein
VDKAVVGCCPVKEAFTGQGFLVVGWWQGGGKNCFQFSMAVNQINHTNRSREMRES